MTMAGQSDRVSMVLYSVTKKVVMIERMAVQRDGVLIAMKSETKMATNMNNRMNVAMLVTMAVHRNRVSIMMSSVTTPVVTIAMMAVQRNKISVVMNPVTKKLVIIVAHMHYGLMTMVHLKKMASCKVASRPKQQNL